MLSPSIEGLFWLDNTAGSGSERRTLDSTSWSTDPVIRPELGMSPRGAVNAPVRCFDLLDLACQIAVGYRDVARRPLGPGRLGGTVRLEDLGSCP